MYVCMVSCVCWAPEIRVRRDIYVVIKIRKEKKLIDGRLPQSLTPNIRARYSRLHPGTITVIN